jgi:hypothetical protein
MTTQYLTVFFTSSILLATELLQVRLMGFSHWSPLVYFTITLALLGFAISGTVLSCCPKIRFVPLPTWNALCLMGFCLFLFLAMMVAALHVPDIRVLLQALMRGDYLPAARYYIPLLLLLIVPFLLTSLVICRALMEDQGRAHLTYSVNLLGTAVGAGLFLGLIDLLGVYRMMYLLMVASSLLAIFNNPRSRALKGCLWISLLLSLEGSYKPYFYFFPNVDPSKNIAPLYPGQVMDTRWTPLCRADICRTGYGALITMDGDAQTWVYAIDEKILNSDEPHIPDPGHVSRQAVFRMVPEARRNHALIIGTGGGMDVMAAHQAGFRKIDAVDIEKARIIWLKGKYAHLNAGLYNLPHVTTHITDGRSFVMRTRNHYDAVVLYNVDSLTASTIGAYNLVENYLYTEEAVRNYLDVLSDDGVLQLTRPHWTGADLTEVYRLFNTLVSVLLERVLVPEEHLLLFQHGGQWDFLVSRRPLRTEAVVHLLSIYKVWGLSRYIDMKQTGILYPPSFRTLSGPLTHNLDTFLGAKRAGTLHEVYGDYPTDIRPVTDDRPYFFENRKWAQALRHPMKLLATSQYNNWSGTFLTLSFLLSFFIVALLVLFGYRAGFPRPPPTALIISILYFGSIGLGYMLIQITLIQKAALALGHPIYAMTVVIPTLLASMGVASAGVSTRLFRRTGVQLAVIALPALAILFVDRFFSPHMGWGSSRLFVRMVFVVLALCPLGCCLGVCFPLGLRIFGPYVQGVIPLAWTINGGASVLGSLCALGLSLVFGFHVTLNVAAACYLLALFSVLGFSMSRSQETLLSPA